MIVAGVPIDFVITFTGQVVVCMLIAWAMLK